MTEDRRAEPHKTDIVAAMLAFLYTFGYFAIVFLMTTRGIPEDNEGAVNQLIGALTIIQTGIIGYYFGGSKANEQTQAANVVRSLRSEAVVQEIAKATVPPVVAPIQTDLVNVEATTANVTEVKP